MNVDQCEIAVALAGGAVVVVLVAVLGPSVVTFGIVGLVAAGVCALLARRRERLANPVVTFLENGRWLPRPIRGIDGLRPFWELISRHLGYWDENPDALATAIRERLDRLPECTRPALVALTGTWEAKYGDADYLTRGAERVVREVTEETRQFLAETGCPPNDDVLRIMLQVFVLACSDFALRDAYAQPDQAGAAVPVPDSITGCMRRALEHIEKHEHGEAIAQLSKAIRREPSFFPAYHERARCYQAMGQWDRATADYTETIRLDPKNTMSYCNWGLMLSAQGRHAEACDKFAKSVWIDPADVEALLAWGAALSQMGQAAEAEEKWRKAIGLNPALKPQIEEMRKELLRQE